MDCEKEILEILNKLDEVGYKYKKINVYNDIQSIDEEHIVITNGINSCSFRIADNQYWMYEIVYDFDDKCYFLLYRMSFIRSGDTYVNLEEVLDCIDYLIETIDIESLKKKYGVKKLKKKELKQIREICKNKDFLVFDLYLNDKEYLLISKNNKKWIAIEYKDKCKEYIYSTILVDDNNNLRIEMSYREEDLNFKKTELMIENPYDRELYYP